MTFPIDETHDVSRRSWVPGATGHQVFPLQNLPFGIFSSVGGKPRGGVAIGDFILDLGKAVEAGLFSGVAGEGARAAAETTLNSFLALGKKHRTALRKQLFALLAEDAVRSGDTGASTKETLYRAEDCTLHLPVNIGNFTDFYAGIHHAYNGGVRNKRNPPLSPNYKYVPVAYHSRASSIVASGHTVRRPNGQIKTPDTETPVFRPAQKLDFELELGIWIGTGNLLGEPIPISSAADHIAGLCMLNDWTARDIQAWESAPLGPFLSKNFTTTISPWIVTLEALAPYTTSQPARHPDDPQPLPYLFNAADQIGGTLDIGLEVLICTENMRAQKLEPHCLSSSNVRHLYWTIAQLVAHHTCGGCNLLPGDLLGSGTISAPARSGWGSMAELSEDGKTPFTLPSGETRGFLEDNDELILRASASRDGYATIGFGDCVGRITPARPFNQGELR